ncbi:MAG: DUF1971 domain-containing protein [Bacteriovoracaceae bacterium]|nr:DUF1971 domain-containing protein [Bacteriovoracaceae bacterium]
MKIPSDFVNYRSTKVFTKDTVPKLLVKSHNTKAGVYGKITVLNGALKFYGLESDNGAVEAEVLISANESAISPPQYWHRVEFTTDDTTFKIDFYAQKDSDVAIKNLSERDDGIIS